LIIFKLRSLSCWLDFAMRIPKYVAILNSLSTRGCDCHHPCM
jgi:hypothetical protein